ncbi:MAG TPA: LPS export ABC transporter permease LptG [Coxiellaceae bacterium]|nr:MAG: LPS export ABC transporter permease LptG [Gammaproteobacteria bacterium RIFCSPHIGHO2_12_FULL_36_30]HLB56749.1 LPS export ABC transporter permease LptG [Coxiellaceae bacterium]
MKILDRYIRNAILVATGMVSAIIIALQSFFSLVEQFRFIGLHDYSIWKVFLFVLMQLVAQFYQLFPMIAFLGALIGLTRLSSTSQLIVMRAAGFSVIQIAWSVMKTGILMIFVITLLGEGLGPQWQQESMHMRQTALSPPTNSILQSVWLHQGDSFTHIGELKNKSVMEDVIRYSFAPSGRLERATEAQSGHFENGKWELSDLKKSIFTQNQIEIEKQANSALHIAFQPDLQLQMSIVSAEQTLVDLYHTIAYRKSIGLGVNQYVFSFCQRLLQPFTTLVMICLSVPFVFGSFRSASMSMRIIGGAVIGFLFYMLNQLFGPITLVYQFPPLLAAIIPTFLFLFITMILLARTK